MIKRHLSLVIFLLINALNYIELHACLVEYPTHNYYMISYVNHNNSNNIFDEGINTFWKTYTNGLYEEYPLYDRLGLEKYISNRKDQEMLDYVNALNIYLDICNDIDYWTYPTEEDLRERTSNLQMLESESKSYSGTRLRSQYSLLYMRCKMLMNKWDEIKDFWETKGKNLPDNVFRSMMENIYAGSLYRSGDIIGSTSIYLRQGDEASIKWVLNKYQDIDGIRYIYTLDPNSILLPNLIQDYVNGVQESLDNSYQVSFHTSIYKFLLSLQCISFYNLSEEVISSHKSENPCMWSTASAMLYYLNGEYAKAKEESSRALQLDGTDRIKENSRCVNILINSSDTLCDRSWLTNELLWLEEKVKNEHKEDYCYSNAYERILMKSLYPIYKRHNNLLLSLAVTGLYNELVVSKDDYNPRSQNFNKENGPTTWNPDYDSEYMNEYIYPLSAKTCKDYYDYLNSTHSDKLVNHICEQVYKDPNFFNDLIGTKYISECKFSEAIPYLEKVDLSYLKNQNTSDYMHKRDFTLARWLVHQGSKYDKEGISKQSFKSNPKLDYCHMILDLEKKFKKSKKKSDKYQIAYQLACLYYQGSYKGECWWLSSYCNSINEEHVSMINPSKINLINKTKEYLKFCLSSDDFDIKSKSLYALAYIPIDKWAEHYSDYSHGRTITTYYDPNPESSQYHYLSMLNDFYENNKERVPSYISKCDVLKQFRKLKWYSE
mgnify:CR=1 FL=1